MPFYEYQCKSCGHTLEAMQKVNDPPLRKCPECGKAQLTRLMSAPVFRLKGAGWYETDFKGEQDHKKNLADRPEAETAKEDKAPAADAKAPEAGKEAAKPEKTADKPVEKTAVESAKPPTGVGMSKRGVASVKPAAKPAAKSRAKKPIKKPAAKARARR